MEESLEIDFFGVFEFFRVCAFFLVFLEKTKKNQFSRTPANWALDGRVPGNWFFLVFLVFSFFFGFFEFLHSFLVFRVFVKFFSSFLRFFV